VDRDLMPRARSRAFGALLLVAALGAGCSVSTTSSHSGETVDGRPVDLLRHRGAAARAVAGIERLIGAVPARATDVLVYPEYMDMKAQDPEVPEHIDEYEWRTTGVSGPEPVHLTGPQEDVEASLFPTTAVRWRDVPGMVRDVEARARGARPIRIEGARVSYLIVRRSTSPDADGRVEIDAYLSGPRRSGYAELTATGELIALHVS
jgi:hypothetical protein